MSKNEKTHIGGDLYGKFDGRYVDILDRDGKSLCFLSEDTLVSAYGLIEKDIFEFKSPLVLTDDRKTELRTYATCGQPVHGSLLTEVLSALEAAELQRERLRLELRLEQRRRQDREKK